MDAEPELTPDELAAMRKHPLADAITEAHLEQWRRTRAEAEEASRIEPLKHHFDLWRAVRNGTATEPNMYSLTPDIRETVRSAAQPGPHWGRPKRRSVVTSRRLPADIAAGVEELERRRDEQA